MTNKQPMPEKAEPKTPTQPNRPENGELDEKQLNRVTGGSNSGANFKKVTLGMRKSGGDAAVAGKPF